jgi:hypothetical protein
MKKIVYTAAFAGVLSVIGISYAFTSESKGLEPYCVTLRSPKGLTSKYNIEANHSGDAKTRAEAQYQGYKCVNVVKGKCH